MLAENLENLMQKERLQSEKPGKMRGMQKGRLEGRFETKRETALNLISMNFLTDESNQKFLIHPKDAILTSI